MKTGTFRFAKTNGFRKVEQLREQHENDRKFISRLKKVKSEVTRQQMMTGTGSSWMHGGILHTASSTASHFRGKESVEHLPAVEQARDRNSSRGQASASSFRRRPREFAVWFDESKAKPLKVAQMGKNLYAYQVKVKPSQQAGGVLSSRIAQERPPADIGSRSSADKQPKHRPAASKQTSSQIGEQHKEAFRQPQAAGDPAVVFEEDRDDDESREISYQLKQRTRYSLTIKSAKVPVELEDICMWQELADLKQDGERILVLELSQHHGEQKKKVRVTTGSQLDYFGKGMELKIWLVDRVSGALHLCSTTVFDNRNT